MSLLSQRILKRAGRAGVARAKARIPSRALRRACSFKAEENTPVNSFGRISIPHYWAVIVHDGRKRVVAKPGKILVWFRDPSKDPRFPGKNHPRRLASRKKLTKAQWEEWTEKNRNARGPKPMVIAKQSSAVKGDPFFGNNPGEGMFGFKDDMDSIATEEMRREVDKFLKSISATGVEESRAVISL